MEVSLFGSMVAVLFKGIVIGLSIAAPVGPIGVLCIRRTITQGRLSGLLSGLGAATADAFYGALAGFGLALVTDVLIGLQTWLRLLGGLFLCFLGVRNLLARSDEQRAAASDHGLAGAYLSTLVLTLSNPVTILSFIAIYAGVGAVDHAGDYLAAGTLVLGVFIGSVTWWLFLSGGVSLVRGRFGPAQMRWVNRLSGIILVGFGIYALLGLIL